MDVKEIQAATLAGAAGKKGNPEAAHGGGFEKILQQAEASRKGEAGFGPLPETPEIHANRAPSLSSASFLTGLESPSNLRAQGALASERMLTLLQRYQEAMSDPNLPLRQIRPVVDSLSVHLHDLTDRLGKIPPSDPLRKIMTEIGVLSSVEIEKFQRGDYS